MRRKKLRWLGIALLALSCGGCAAAGTAASGVGSLLQLALSLVAIALPFGLAYYLYDGS